MQTILRKTTLLLGLLFFAGVSAIFVAAADDSAFLDPENESRVLYVGYEEYGQEEDLLDELTQMLVFAQEKGFDRLILEGGSLGETAFPCEGVRTRADARLDIVWDDLRQKAEEKGIALGLCVHLSESGERGKAEGGPRFSWFATPDTPYYYSYPIDGVTYLDLGQPSVQQLVRQVLTGLKALPCDFWLLDGLYYPHKTVDDAATFAQSGQTDQTAYRKSVLQPLLAEAFAYAGETPVGIAVPEQLTTLLEGGLTVDLLRQAAFLAPKMQSALDGVESGYAPLLDSYVEACGDTLPLLPLSDARRMESGDYLSPYEMNIQILYNRSVGLSGFCLMGYQPLKNTTAYLDSMKALFTERDLTYTEALQTPEGLHFGRPSNNVSTSDSAYFVTGISDPEQALYFNGEKVEKRGENGEFGLLIELKEGKNVLTLTQGSASESLTITRTTPSGGDGKITTFTQSSLYPYYDDIVPSSEELTLSCIAPAGGKVTVTVGGKTYSLEQKIKNGVENGTPATFSATLSLPRKVEQDEVEDWGQLVYQLTYNGEKTEGTSSGRLYVVGEKAQAQFRVSYPFANVYETAAETKSVVTYLPLNTRGYIDGVEGQFVKTACGYLHKGQIEVLTGKSVYMLQPTQEVITSRQNREERIVFAGMNMPVYRATLQGDTLQITLYDVEEPAQPVFAENSLVGNFSYRREERALTITLTAKEGRTLWGYDLQPGETGTVLFLKEKAAQGEKPLSGVQIVVDAGHGGSDPGAVGAPGYYGPTESELNLAIAYRLKEKLENWGATVTMTRVNEQWVTLQDRLTYAAALKPDFFIAIHQNSLGTATDAGKVDGLEVYYYDENSGAFAQSIADAMGEASDRSNRGSVYSYFYVTKTSFARSVLVENGYLPNPQEYAQMIRPEQLDASAEGIAQGVRKTFEKDLR